MPTVAESVESRVGSITTNDPWEFLASFLDAFDFPKATFERLIILKNESGYSYVRITNKIFYSVNVTGDIATTLAESKGNLINGKPFRFYIVSDGTQMAAYDSAKDLYLKCFSKNLNQHFLFFLPLVGIEAESTSKSNVDEDISVEFAKLSNQIVLDSRNSKKAYNDFLIRLLLICIATGFDDDAFGDLSNIAETHIGKDGSDVLAFLRTIDSAVCCGGSVPGFASKIPHIPEVKPLPQEAWPYLDDSAAATVLSLLRKDWGRATPDVIGAVFQASRLSDDSSMPFNYTSAIYVSYLSSPLFLREMRKAFSEAFDNQVTLLSLLTDVQSLILFDPSCGTASVLSMVYSDLKKLEADIINRLSELSVSPTDDGRLTLQSVVGLEPDPLKAEAACITLALVDNDLLDSRSVKDFASSYSIAKSSIVRGDPILTDWNDMCPNNGSVMVVANPEYRGARRMTQQQRLGKNKVFEGVEGAGDLDYSSCWLVKASEYIRGTTSKAAFFVTNSITQGAQASVLWPVIFDNGVEIAFAHKSFKWKTAARNTNAVTVVAIGLSAVDSLTKKVIDDGKKIFQVKQIGPYLTESVCFVSGRSHALSDDLPKMIKGNMPYEHGLLMMDAAERDEFIAQYPSSNRFLKRVIGGNELINDLERWCIWTPSEEVAKTAETISGIKQRFDDVREWRAGTTASASLKASPFRFREVNETSKYSLVIPNLSSENYAYIPMMFVDSNTIVTNLAFVVYDCDPLLFGILSSRIHNLWAKTVGGGYETRIRYSNRLVYNTFPIPALSPSDKERIKQCALSVLSERERYYEMSLAKMYSNLPESLAACHCTLDLAVDQCFQSCPFADDSERLDLLFELYEGAVK